MTDPPAETVAVGVGVKVGGDGVEVEVAVGASVGVLVKVAVGVGVERVGVPVLITRCGWFALASLVEKLREVEPGVVNARL